MYSVWNDVKRRFETYNKWGTFGLPASLMIIYIYR